MVVILLHKQSYNKLGTLSGNKINAGTSDLVLNVNGQASTLVYANVTVGWVLKSLLNQ